MSEGFFPGGLACGFLRGLFGQPVGALLHFQQMSGLCFPAAVDGREHTFSCPGLGLAFKRAPTRLEMFQRRRKQRIIRSRHECFER